MHSPLCQLGLDQINLKTLQPIFIRPQIILIRIRLQNTPQLLHLRLRLLSNLFINALKSLTDRRFLFTLGSPELLKDSLPELITRLPFLVLAPQPLVFQPLAQPDDGVIAAFPVLDLDAGPVRKAIVAGAVVRDAVAHRLDEDGFPAVGEGDAARFLRCFVDGEDVVAVDADGVDAVAYAAAGNAVAAILFQGWGGDGVAVVAADENDGAGAGGGEVEAGVEIAFAGGAFAEVAGDDTGGGVGVLEGLDFEGVGCS